MNDQIVELSSPGLHILLYTPAMMARAEEGGDYARVLPDGRDLVDHINRGRLGAIGVRWPGRDYWLHFSSTMDQSVIRRASDHARLGLRVERQQLCVRGSDDLFRWSASVPDEQLVTVDDGLYEVTACMVSDSEDGPARIYVSFAAAVALPELGYQQVPELFGQPPVA